MCHLLRQSTAVDIGIGPFVDNVDGFTAETALTISQADVRLKKNAGAWAQKNQSSAATHEENGWYEVSLDTTDTNTLGLLVVAVNESGALPVWKEFMVVPANVYDSLVGGSDTLNTDITQWNGTNVATPTVAGVPEVDVTHWNGTAIPGVDTAGYPKVTVKDGTGAGEIDTNAGAVKLAADGLDAITNTTVSQADVTAGLNFRQKIIWNFQRWFNKHILDANTDTIKVHNDSGTVCSTQNTTEASGVQTVNKAA